MGLYGESWCIELGLGATCLLFFLGYKIRRRLNYFKDRGFPSMSLGKLLALTVRALSAKITFPDVVNEIYKHFDGHKIGGYQMFSWPVMMVRDPDLINKVLVKDFSYFHDHGFDVDTEVNPLEGHLFNMNGPQWRALRNKLTPTFTSSKLKAMLPQISDSAEALTKILRSDGPKKDVLVRELISRFTIDVIGSCAFGLEAGALKDPDCEFNRMAKKIFRPTNWQIAKGTFRGLFPKLAIRLKMKTIDDEVNDFFFGVTRQAFELRTKSALKRNDFLDLLLQLKLKGSVDCDPKELAEEESPTIMAGYSEESEKLVLTDELLAAQSFVFLVAGWENLSIAISFALYCLAKHPDAQQKAREEVRRVKEKHNGNFTYEALKEMVYLDSCISESTRLYPPAAVLLHRCTKNYTMDDGRVIEKGTFVLVPNYALQKDPAYFEDPEEYRPERFMPDHCVPNNVYLPFGDGPRICIARRFVLLEVKLALSKLLDNFRFVNSPEMIEPLQFDPKSFMDIKGGMKMRFEPLED